MKIAITTRYFATLAITATPTGAVLPEPRFDLTTSLCKLRDLFSRH